MHYQYILSTLSLYYIASDELLNCSLMINKHYSHLFFKLQLRLHFYVTSSIRGKNVFNWLLLACINIAENLLCQLSYCEYHYLSFRGS